jgi:hypothetical protein
VKGERHAGFALCRNAVVCLLFFGLPLGWARAQEGPNGLAATAKAGFDHSDHDAEECRIIFIGFVGAQSGCGGAQPGRLDGASLRARFAEAPYSRGADGASGQRGDYRRHDSEERKGGRDFPRQRRVWVFDHEKRAAGEDPSRTQLVEDVLVGNAGHLSVTPGSTDSGASDSHGRGTGRNGTGGFWISRWQRKRGQHGCRRAVIRGRCGLSLPV